MTVTAGSTALLAGMCIMGCVLHSAIVLGAGFDGRTTTVEAPLEISERLGGAPGVTFSAWVKRDPAGLNRRNEIMNLTISGTLAKAVIGFLPDNTIRVGGRTRPDEQFRSATTVSAWSDDEWRHVVGVIDLERASTRIYVDGDPRELKTEATVWSDTVFPSETGIRNTIGSGANLKNHFHGELKDIKVYNRALDDEEVSRLYILGANIDRDEIASLIFAWEGDETPAVAQREEKPAETRPEAPLVDRIEMIDISGSPREIGRIRGDITGDAIRSRVEKYLKTQQRDIPLETLKFYAQPGVDRVREIAPHWLEELEATAETAGVDPDIYIALQFAGLLFSARGRGWQELCTERAELEHECTSYAATGEAAENKGIFYHKTRDNVRSTQRAYIKTSDLPGIYKYIQVATISINERGLAMSGDYGGPRPEIPRYRGRFSFAQHIMERAADCDEALAILQDFVAKGWYAGGTRTGQRWTIVDRHGNILDVTNSSDPDSLKWNYVKNGGPHITRTSAKRLRETEKPVSFLTFRDISRDTLVKSSIAGCTVDIHPEYPEYLSMIWISFPARSLPFLLFSGGRKTPLPLYDGTVDDIGWKSEISFDVIRELEQTLYEEGKRFQSELYELIKAGRSGEVAGMIDEWIKNHTKRHMEILLSSR